MATKRIRVCVIGAGIIGLPTACRLQEAVRDVDITIVSEEFSPNTTGDGSAGFWRPYFVAGTPDELVWCVSANANFDKNVVTCKLLNSLYKMACTAQFWASSDYTLTPLTEFCSMKSIILSSICTYGQKYLPVSPSI